MLFFSLKTKSIPHFSVFLAIRFYVDFFIEDVDCGWFQYFLPTVDDKKITQTFLFDNFHWFSENIVDTLYIHVVYIL